MMNHNLLVFCVGISVPIGALVYLWLCLNLEKIPLVKKFLEE